MIALGFGVSACGSVSGKPHDAATQDDDAAVMVTDTAGPGTTPDTGGGGAGGDNGGIDSGTLAIELVEGAIVSLGSQASATGVTLESDGFELVDQMCSADGTVCLVGGLGP